MKKRWGIGLFFLGALLGWMIGNDHHDGPGASKTNHVAVAEIHRERKVEPAREAHAQKWQSLGKRSLTFSTEERDGFLKSLAPDDRGKALDALMSQVGPGFTSSQVIAMMSEILKSWAHDDVEGVLSYIGKCSNEGMRKFMMGQLLEILAENDPDRAIKLYAEQSAEDPSFQSNVVFRLAQTRMGENAGQLLDLLSKLPMNSSSAGTGVNFSKDYDFQSAADGIAAMIKANPNKTPTVLPMNLMESWAARDPDAAHAWWAKNGSFEYNDWSKVLNGVEKHSTPEAAAEWVIAKFEEPGAPRGKMIRDLSNSSNDGVAARINAIARAMPDIAAQDRFLGDVVLVNWDGIQNRYGFAISGLSSPQARLDVFRKIAAQKCVPDLRAINDSQFTAWGINRQQVEQLLKPEQILKRE
jgi:hypothetical protein